MPPVPLELLKRSLADCTLSHSWRRNGVIGRGKMTRDEYDFTKQRVAELTFLDSVDDKSGLSAVAFREKKSGKLILAISGAESHLGFSELAKDLDDALASAMGAVPQQYKPLLSFASRVKEKFGHIDRIVGQSTGAYLGTCLKANDQICDSKTELVRFNGSGVTRSIIYSLGRMNSVSEDIVRNRLNNRTTSFITVYDAYTAPGEQPGEVYTLRDRKNFILSPMPESHMLSSLIRDFKNDKAFNSIHPANTKDKPLIHALPLSGIFGTIFEASHVFTRAVDLVAPRQSHEKSK